MNKFSKVLLTVMCLMLFTTSAMAFSGIKGGPQQISGAADTANAIIGALQWAGYAIAAGMIVFIGIKYIMASANEKADLKNSLIKYVAGAILIAGGVTIAGWIFTIVS